MSKDGSVAKRTLATNVYQEAVRRISYTFDHFPRVYLSFSAGKDSTVMLHLAAEEARKRGIKFGCLIIDMEAQYQHSVAHIEAMLEEYKDVLNVYWVCLPMALRNAVSVYEPKWQCWNPEQKALWVRPMPKHEGVISDESFFPFWERNMEFEDFIHEFGKWYAGGLPCAAMIGIRCDESLNRMMKITVSHNREFFGKNRWLLRQKSTRQYIYSCHPIYDWKTKDIWTYHAKFKDKRFNEIYELMNKAGVSIHQQRLCQPFGDDQRKGLWLFQILEPDTWAKLLSRVAGVNSGAEFVKFNGNASGQIKISKPDGHTWESFSKLLLESMPTKMRDHYEAKVMTFIKWYEEREGYRVIPDEADPKLEVAKKVPSWRRICKTLLRNDYYCKNIGFTADVSSKGYMYERYMANKKKELEQRKKKNASFRNFGF